MPLKNQSTLQKMTTEAGNTKRKFVVEHEDHFLFTHQHIHDELPAGVYFPETSNDGSFLLRHANFIKIEQSSDYSILDGVDNDFISELESALNEDEHMFEPVKQSGYSYLEQNYFPIEKYHEGFAEIRESVYRFLQNKEFYKTNHIDFKRSVLLYGEPGVGKSRFVANICDELINGHEAIVIRIENSHSLEQFASKGTHVLNSFCDGRLIVIVIEELANMGRGGASTLLNFLDSTYFKDNVIYLMTTNYPDRIPENIISRPSRVDDLCSTSKDVKESFTEDFYHHLMGERLPESEKNSDWYSRRTELNLSYLKELILFAQTHQLSLQKSWERLVKRKKLIKENFQTREAAGFTFD